MKKILSISILILSISAFAWGYVSWDTQLIQASTTTGTSPLIVEFSANNQESEAQYKWSIWWTPLQYSRDFVHIFPLPGSYDVSLEVIDTAWFTQSSTLSVVAQDEANCWSDYDGDQWDNCIDLCPLVAWSDDNTGCPSFNVIPAPVIETSCYYQADKNYIFGNAICNTCPCQHSLSYKAQLRKCDVLFPAIVSPDETQIYQRWDFFEIQ